MDKNSPLTFNNVDPETFRVLITPRGPDPILCGIRGETPEAVLRAYDMLNVDEPVERWMIFRTNQGTDAHLKKVIKIKDLQPYNSAIIEGVVNNDPKVIQGGHVIFSIKDESGEVDCAAYEPTFMLSKKAKKLIAGDVLRLYGGVRPISENRFTINLEKMEVLTLASKLFFTNPICPECGKRLKSMGKNQGFRCDRCRYRSSNLRKFEIKQERELKKGFYITSPRSQRHLTKPYIRYGREKTGKSIGMIKEWHYP
jgi:tRNA(Ile2)-agmatinylcytidine synthase